YCAGCDPEQSTTKHGRACRAAAALESAPPAAGVEIADLRERLRLASIDFRHLNSHHALHHRDCPHTVTHDATFEKEGVRVEVTPRRPSEGARAPKVEIIGTVPTTEFP